MPVADATQVPCPLRKHDWPCTDGCILCDSTGVAPAALVVEFVLLGMHPNDRHHVYDEDAEKWWNDIDALRQKHGLRAATRGRPRLGE